MLTEFLSDLRRLGVHVWTDGGQLRYRAPARVLTPDLRAELAKHKTDLLALLHGDPLNSVVEHVPLPTVTPDTDRRHDPFPLTDIQHAYWIGRGDAFELGNVSTHAYLEFESGDLDVERLNDGWCALIARHDMLRAVVGEDGRQQILAAVPAYRMAVLDLRAATAGAAAAAVAAVRERMAHQVYAPAAWPLFEVRATRLAAGRVRVHFSIDLLIADVWSLFLLFREWGALYEAPERPLARLTVSFRDYVLAEAALQETALYARAQAYWAARVATLPPGPELPLARQPGSLAAPRFVRRSSRLEPAVWAALQRRGRQAGLTPSMVLCAAFAEVLATWSKHAAFSLNVTLFHRLPLHAEVAALVGDFTSTVLLAVEAGGPASFAARAQQLQQQLWADLEHRYVSGVRVLRDLARHAGRGPGLAMPVVFTSTLGQEGGDTPAPTGWLGELVYGLSQTPQVWLDHQVGEDGAALVFNWDVVEALFPAGLVAAMFEAYCGYLMRLATEAGAWEEPTRGLVPAAQLRVRAAMNATTAPVPEDTLPALVAAQVRARPGALAVRAPGRQLSYAEVDRAARVVARGLRRHGAAPNRLVAVVMEPGWEQVVAVLGVGHAGAAYLPIEADVPAERLRALLAQGEVGVVLTQSWLLATRAWPAEVTRLAVDAWETWGDAPLEEGERPAPRSDALAYVIFTSGSTGVPKGVMVTHRAAVNTLVEVNRRWAVGPADRVLALSALSFDLSVYDIVGTLAAGGTVVLPEAAARRDPAHWLALLAGEGVTIWNSVPALMQLLIETAEARGVRLPETLRLVLLSGDWIPVSLPDRIRARAPGAEVISLGGATEAAIWSIYFPIAAVDPQWASIPYGRPLANQTWHVLHPTGAPCPEWVPGELYIGGSGLAAGYWRDPETTRARFLAHPQSGERLYRTGDWGRYLPDGQLEFLGRADLQVKVQGYRIELGEIETALAQHPGVDRAVVAAVGDRAGDKRLVAYVVPRGTPPPAAAVRAFLRETLPDYLVPTAVVFLPTLPLTPNGKVDRNALRALNPAECNLDTEFVAPRDPLELQLAAIWKDVLGVDRIGVRNRFFDVGGNSLLAVRLMVRVQQTFGKGLPVPTLFHADDIESLARVIRQERPTMTSLLVPMQSSGATPPFFCVHPVGGHVLCYMDLVHCLGDGRLFYGIQARGLQGDVDPFSDIPAMARLYLDEIRAVQPQGPYLLGGWSMGGIVALEIARQLDAHGEETAILALLDAETSADAGQTRRAAHEPNPVHAFWRDLAGLMTTTLPAPGELSALDVTDEALSRIGERAKSANVIPSDIEPGQLRQLLRVFTSHDHAMRTYRQQPYSGRVTLFRAREQPLDGDHDLGWGEIATGGVDVHVVPGDHYTMLQRPNVEALAAQLRICLEAAAPRPSDRSAGFNPGNVSRVQLEGLEGYVTTSCLPDTVTGDRSC